MSLTISLPTADAVTVPAPLGRKRDLLTHLSDDEYLFVIDNSSTEKFKRCPTMGKYYSVLGREPHAKNSALVFGGAIHKGLEALALGKSELEQNTAICDYFAAHPTPLDVYRTPANALEVLKHYRVRCTFPDYAGHIICDGDGPIVERPFEIPIAVYTINAMIANPAWPEPRFVKRVHAAWSGKIDMLWHREDSLSLNENKPHVLDHKTTSMDGEPFLQQFELASQTRGYVWAGRQKFELPDLDSFCLDKIRLKKPSGSGSLIEKGPRGGEPPLDMQRYYYTYTDDSIAEWLHDTKLWISDFLQRLVHGNFPMNDQSCVGKYGACPYFQVCTIPQKEVRTRFLASDAFTDVTWNPTTA